MAPTLTHPLALLAAATGISVYCQFSLWVLLALCFMAVNVKALPGVYHIRILPSLLRLYLPEFMGFTEASRRVEATGPLLFSPHVLRTRACALECDINLHKSNSTFFSDMDVSRAAMLTTLFHTGLRRLSSGGKGPRVHFILVAAQVSFHRQIFPYQAYEVHSQIVGWDGKWVYVGSWFVTPGVAAGRLMLQHHVEGGSPTVDSPKDEKARKGVLASAVSRYVLKQGKVTVPPVRLLEETGFLPKRGGEETCSNDSANGKPGSADESVLGDVEKLRMSGWKYVKEFVQ